MKARKQSSTAYPILFLMVDSTDHVTGKTGLSPTVTLSKNGGAFVAKSGAVTEVGNGWYALAGHATDRNTLGELIIHATAPGADPVDERYEIVAYDPFLRVNANTEQWGGSTLPAVSTLTAAGVRSAVGLASANLDTQLANLDTQLANVPTAVNTAMTTAHGSGSWTTATGFSTLTAKQVWEYATRTLSAFSFQVTVGVNNDKTGYALTSAYDAAKTASQAGDQMALTASALSSVRSGLSTFNPATDKVYLGNGAHGGAAASLTLSNYSAFKATGFATPSDLAALQTHGDSNWATATGFSTLTTADIDARLAAWGKTGFSLSATTGWGGTALPTSFAANNLPSKYPATLAATDVSGALPANVVQWNSGALPSIGTSNLTAQQVWEYANRTLTSMGFPVNLTPETRAALVAAIEVELANDSTGEALMQAIADKLAAEFDLDELSLTAIRDAILNRVLAGNHDTPGTVGALLQNLNAPIDSRAPAATALSTGTWTESRAAMLDKLGVTGTLAHTGNADLFKATGFATPSDLAPLATTAQLNALQTHGDAHWATATGFTVPADLEPLTTSLATIDQKVSEILEDTGTTGVVMAGYTPPDNEGIAAIKAQTDKLAFVGGDVKATLDGEKVAATLAAGDVTGNLPALVNGYAAGLDPVAIDTAAIAEAARDAILNRILAGNHDAAGTVGVLLQKLDVGGDIANTSNADSFKATGFAVPGSAMTLTSGERNAVADAVLSRDVANAEASAAEHSLCTIVLASLESSISGTAWTIKRTDGVTTHATKTLTTDETADPITGVS